MSLHQDDLPPLAAPTSQLFFFFFTSHGEKTAGLVTAMSLVQSVSRGLAGALCYREPHSTGRGLLRSISVSSLKGKSALFG